MTGEVTAMKVALVLMIGLTLGAVMAIFNVAYDFESRHQFASGLVVGQSDNVYYAGLELCEGLWAEQERCLKQNGLDPEPVPWQVEEVRF